MMFVACGLLYVVCYVLLLAGSLSACLSIVGLFVCVWLLLCDVCMLFAVHCFRLVVCCVLFAVCPCCLFVCMLFAVCCLLIVVR